MQAVAASTAADSPEAVSVEEADMHGDALGILLSVLLIGICLVLAFIVSRFGKRRLGDASSEIARKIVHIGVSNWFFIYYHVFESDLWPILGLAAFALINLLLNVTGGLSVMMGQGSKKRNWGLVEYPISVILLIVLKMLGFGDAVCVGCGLLCMGYGDGLAALVGRSVKSRKMGIDGRKSLAGFVTMVAVTFFIFVALKLVYVSGVSAMKVLGIGLLCAVIAALVEAYTPFGLDNISVPLTIYLVSVLV